MVSSLTGALASSLVKRRLLEIADVDARPLLAHITCPVLGLHGSADHLVSRPSVQETLVFWPIQMIPPKVEF
jgi:pimeloyl-ACP methyl ester carboxylesterase